MSTFHLYPHSEVIASSFTSRFEDKLRWLYKTDKTNRNKVSATEPIVLFEFPFIGIATVFGSIDLESSSLAAVLRRF